MTIAEDYLRIANRVAETTVLPPVREIHVAACEEETGKSSKFGAMVLDDDSVGLTFVDLNCALHDLQSRPERQELIGCSPVEAVRLYSGEAGWQRSLGMAAVNAISQHVFKRCSYDMITSGQTLDLFSINREDHVGMVGYFPPLVDQIRTLSVPLTVVELDQKWLQKDDAFEVTLDTARLSKCNKILCTGATLVNHSLEHVLQHAKDAKEIHIVGPTVGCLPDPLFKRGITCVGGLQVVDCKKFVALWRTQQRWRHTARRYSVLGSDYPGFEAMLQNL